MSISLMFFKGWFSIQNVVMNPQTIDYVLYSPYNNVWLDVSLPKGRAIGIESTGEPFGEDQMVKIQFWGKCEENQSLTRLFLCKADPEKFKELPCKINEGMWVNGIQYC